jgi:hypothetical protein
MGEPRLLPPIAKRGGKLVQKIRPLPFGLGLVAEALRHMSNERFKVFFGNTQQLVQKHPLQAIFVGVGLGYLLSRAGNKTIPG